MTPDAELVIAARSGDQQAFAELYDRYADRVFSLCTTLTRDRGLAEDATADTFVVAWQRLAQLRDPARVRPWLFAIARNRVGRLGAKAARQQPVDPVGDDLDRSSADLDDGVDVGDDVAASIDSEAIAQLFWEAAEGLNENERAVLELSVRQGMEGEELAAALGMTRHHANVVAGRMRTNLERSVGALALARTADGACADLVTLLDGFDGTLTPLWRKRIARHADACDVCEGRRSRKPLVAAAAIPLLLAPSTVKAQVLDRLPVAPDGTPLADAAAFHAGRSGFPLAVQRITRIAVQAGGAAVASVALVVGVAVVVDRGDTTDRAAAIEATATRDGNDPDDEASARVDDDRGATTTMVASDEEAEGDDPEAEGEGDEPVGDEADATSTTIDGAVPAPAAPGTTSPPVAVRPGGGGGGGGGGTAPPPTTTTTTTPPDTQAPALTGSSVGETVLRQQGCGGGSTTTTVTATGSDDRGITSGRVEVRVGPTTRTFSLSGSGGSVSGTIGPFDGTGSMEVTVLWVADAAGNRSGPGAPTFGAVTC